MSRFIKNTKIVASCALSASAIYLWILGADDCVLREIVLVFGCTLLLFYYKQVFKSTLMVAFFCVAFWSAIEESYSPGSQCTPKTENNNFFIYVYEVLFISYWLGMNLLCCVHLGMFFFEVLLNLFNTRGGQPVNLGNDGFEMFNDEAPPGLQPQQVEVLEENYTKEFVDVQEQSELNTCCICLQQFEVKEGVIELPGCKHKYHPPCIRSWFDTHTRCPYCRNDVALMIANRNA